MARGSAAQGRVSKRGREGFLYVAVLFTTLIVMASVAAALSISTANLRVETDRNHRGAALRYAESEIQRQAALMRLNAGWRASLANHAFSNWHPITADGAELADNASVRHRFSDPDGNLTDDPSDLVELTVHARVGRSHSAVTVQLESYPIPLDVLRYGLTAGQDLEMDSGAVSCERPVQVDGDCTTSSYGVISTPRLECSGSIATVVRGDLAAASVTLPGDDVVGIYEALGTEILLAAIPVSGSDLIIQDQVLSPTFNPFGAADPAGIYWFDAQGNDVVIANCRLDATLAIRNANQIEIQGGITWNYPTVADVILATDSQIRFRDVDATLDEAARSVNFNPPGSPYRQSLANVNLTDKYPTELRGVVYTTNDIRIDPLTNGGQLQISGAVIGADVRIDGQVSITQLDELISNPPPGLSDRTPMRFTRGSFRRIPSP